MGLALLEVLDLGFVFLKKSFLINSKEQPNLRTTVLERCLM